MENNFTNLAPIVLFVYNRPWHTEETVESLKCNVLAQESELFIYSDAPKNNAAEMSVQEVREYIKTVDGFKKVTVIERDINLGLAASIIDGVTNIINKYGTIIVLEDDLVMSPFFLKFMNDALTFYKNEEKVWHVSGWNYPIGTDGLGHVFLWRLMNCWGWGTWADKWQYYEKDIEKTISEFSKKDIKKFNLDGTKDFFEQVIANQENKINTWAIFWYVSIFNHHGLCLNPTQTFINNIGNDGSGIHCGKKDAFRGVISLNKNIKFISQREENTIALNKIKKFLKAQKKTFYYKVVNKLSRFLLKTNLIK